MKIIVIGIVLILAPGLVAAHGVYSTVTSDRAAIVTVAYEDGGPLAFESCEVLAPDQDKPVQVGRTDRLGRVVFLPDEVGTWRVRVWTEEGHGLTVPVQVTADMIVREVAVAPGCGRFWKLAAGAGVLFGLFGVLVLIQQRRTA